MKREKEPEPKPRYKRTNYGISEAAWATHLPQEIMFSEADQPLEEDYSSVVDTDRLPESRTEESATSVPASTYLEALRIFRPRSQGKLSPEEIDFVRICINEAVTKGEDPSEYVQKIIVEYEINEAQQRILTKHLDSVLRARENPRTGSHQLSWEASSPEEESHASSDAHSG